MIETAKIETLNLKGIETVSMTVFILTSLVKSYISLNINFLIVSSLFFCQTAQFKVFFRTLFLFIQWIRTFFLFIQWIKTLCSILISSDLLILLWFHCRLVLTKISQYSLHQKMKTQICTVSLIRTELNHSTISEMKKSTDLTTLSKSECTIMKLQINTINLRTTRITTTITVNSNRKMTEWTTSLMRTELSMRYIKNLLRKQVRMLTSIML